jgi:hypothetical protein
MNSFDTLNYVEMWFDDGLWDLMYVYENENWWWFMRFKVCLWDSEIRCFMSFKIWLWKCRLSYAFIAL